MMNTTAHAGLSDVGRVRRENQDRWIADDKLGLYLVADGMGGTFGGELAADAVAQVLPKLLRQKLKGRPPLDDPQTASLVAGAVAKMSDQLNSETQKQLGIREIGSTVVLALVQNRHALVAHLGDSRAYLLRDHRLEQLTKDHSIVQLLLDCNEITADEVATHPSRSQLARFVGMQAQSLPEVRLVDLQPNDRLLLCSDGLTGMLDDAAILAILDRKSRPEEASSQLVATANEAGGRDNVTVLTVSVGEVLD